MKADPTARTVAAAVDAFLASDHGCIVRKRPKGDIEIDARPAGSDRRIRAAQRNRGRRRPRPALLFVAQRDAGPPCPYTIF